MSEHKEVAVSMSTQPQSVFVGDPSDPDIEELTLYGTTLRVAESNMIREGIAPMPIIPRIR